MTAYKIITNGANLPTAFYVIQTIAHGHTTHQDIQHGPYKNEESAKRRIRDLKRKDAAAIGEEAVKLIDNSSEAPATHEFVETPGKIEPFPDLREIATGKIISVEKITASSAYGNHRPVDFIAAEMRRHGPYTFTETVTASPINRQRGVYPAIPKRAYQR